MIHPMICLVICLTSGPNIKSWTICLESFTAPLLPNSAEQWCSSKNESGTESQWRLQVFFMVNISSSPQAAPTPFADPGAAEDGHTIHLGCLTKSWRQDLEMWNGYCSRTHCRHFSQGESLQDTFGVKVTQKKKYVRLQYPGGSTHAVFLRRLACRENSQSSKGTGAQSVYGAARVPRCHLLLFIVGLLVSCISSFLRNPLPMPKTFQYFGLSSSLCFLEPSVLCIQVKKLRGCTVQSVNNTCYTRKSSLRLSVTVQAIPVMNVRLLMAGDLRTKVFAGKDL